MEKKKFISNLLLLASIVVGLNQLLVFQATAGSVGGGAATSSKIQLRDNASQAEIISAILPQEADTVRPFQWNGQDVTLSAQTPGNGYDMLVAMNKAVTLTDPEELSRYDALASSVYHPCCDSPVSSCGCKHAVAAKGVIKYLLTQDYTDDQIRDEVFLWNRYWWPKHYATAAVYLSGEGTNPAEISPQDWLGPQLSTIRAGRKMKAVIGA